MTQQRPRPHIVVGTDFSDCGEAAFEAAIRLAQDMGANLVLVHAFPKRLLPTGSTPTARRAVETMEGEIERDAAIELSTQWAEKARRIGIAVDTVADAGHPADLILAAASKWGAVLVVVGTHGRTGLRRAVLGSVAEEVIRNSDRPVLVVPVPK